MATLNRVPTNAEAVVTRETAAYDRVLSTQANEMLAEKAAEKYAVAQVDVDRLEVLVQSLERLVGALSR